jgi:hypothetical protein
MSLSDRLAAAAEARARAEEAGTTVQHLEVLAVLAPETFGLADPPVATTPRTILITGSDLVPPVSPDPGADPHAICPTCNRTGDIGVVDLPGRTSDWSCGACGTMWRVNLEKAPSR